MSQATNYSEYKVCDHVMGRTSYTKPSTTYLALSTADPGETGSQSNEPSGNGYSRQDASSAFGDANTTTGTAVNSSVMTFGPCTTSGWGTITHGLYCDASTTGNGLVYFALTSSRTIAVGDSLQFATSQLSVFVA
ncbi:MAG: hypothetical protein WC026_16960 [Hyphomicrobium sp.]|uniref:phage tail fiber protein n=1 Tax=Hyphomicrobium sp. TaxID=82 RepID=UPI003564803D